MIGEIRCIVPDCKRKLNTGYCQYGSEWMRKCGGYSSYIKESAIKRQETYEANVESYLRHQTKMREKNLLKKISNEMENLNFSDKDIEKAKRAICKKFELKTIKSEEYNDYTIYRRYGREIHIILCHTQTKEIAEMLIEQFDRRQYEETHMFASIDSVHKMLSEYRLKHCAINIDSILASTKRKIKEEN